ncbi:MAG: FxsA family protein [Pseudomonadales bacterium]|nr:FxsA family protein [Pseudomonadales bacterium]
MKLWFLVFFLTPLLEIYVLISAGSLIGTLPTIALVMLTAVLGITLLRQQGLNTLARGMQKMQVGEMPAQEMAEGLLLAVAGALLLTPGFVTDTVGFLLLTPILRAKLVDRIKSKFDASSYYTQSSGSTTASGRSGRFYSNTAGNSSDGQRYEEGREDQAIEGEFEQRP